MNRWPPLLLAAALCGCAGSPADPGPSREPPPRTFFMGFSGVPPRPDLQLVLRTIDLWSQRADAALILLEPPWTALLAGEDPEALVRNDPLGLANHYRAKGLRIVASIDPTNGLDRSSDAAPLVAARRSLREPAVRALYARYVRAFAASVRPDYLGIASETNLIRAVARPDLYAAVVAAGSEAAAAARAAFPGARLLSTVQVETAWGRVPTTGAYVGIAQDRADFPFAEVLGLSSYPYLGGFAEPEDVPLEYYTRLVEGAPIPLMVIEGGWSSESVAGVTSSPDKQRRYIERQAQLLDAAHAIGVFQITFTDLDLPSLGLPPGSILPAFAFLGLVDVKLAPKPALSSWDATYKRPLRP